jgi:hypothetical protein
MATLKSESHGGIEINYEERGAGDPLVLIGGLTSTLEAWGLMVPERLASLTVGCSHAGGKTAVSPTDAVLQAMLAGSGEGASEETKQAAMAIQIHPDTPEKRADRLACFVQTKIDHPHSAEGELQSDRETDYRRQTRRDRRGGSHLLC